MGRVGEGKKERSKFVEDSLNHPDCKEQYEILIED